MAERPYTALQVLHALQEHPAPGRVTADRVIAITGLSYTAAQRAIRDLRAAGVIQERDELHPENASALHT